MQNTLEVRHVSVSIERAPDEVYRFASQLENWPKWASGLGESMRKAGSEWMPTGVTIHNPFRVLPNGAGSEIVFSVFRQPGTPADDFEADARAVEQDLRALKQFLEQR